MAKAVTKNPFPGYCTVSLPGAWQGWWGPAVSAGLLQSAHNLAVVTPRLRPTPAT